MKPNTRHHAKREISSQIQQLHEDREQDIEELEERLRFLETWDYCEWENNGQHDNPRLHESSELGPVGSGPRRHSGGGYVLDSGECRFAGQGGLFQSTEPVDLTPEPILVRSGNINALAALAGSLEQTLKTITSFPAEVSGVLQTLQALLSVFSLKPKDSKFSANRVTRRSPSAKQ